MPSSDHPIFFAQGLREGQCAALVKADSDSGELPEGSVVPPGTQRPSSNQGTLLTCSDKLLLWNILGLQGSFLHSIFNQRILLTSITIGRKFCESHAGARSAAALKVSSTRKS